MPLDIVIIDIPTKPDHSICSKSRDFGDATLERSSSIRLEGTTWPRSRREGRSEPVGEMPWSVPLMDLGEWHPEPAEWQNIVQAAPNPHIRRQALTWPRCIMMWPPT